MVKALIFIFEIAILVLLGFICSALTACRSHDAAKASLKASVRGNEMVVTLKNLSKEPVVIDGEMELWFHFVFSTPKGLEHVSRTGSGKPVAARLVQLAPGERYTKVFRSGDEHNDYTLGSYSTSDGGGGWFDTMNTYRIPDFSKVDWVSITYEVDSVPYMMAVREKVQLPENLLKTKMSVDVIPGWSLLSLFL